MRLRSEWITVVTLTGLAVCGLMLPKHNVTGPQKQDEVAGSGVDFVPTGTVRPLDKKPAPRRH